MSAVPEVKIETPEAICSVIITDTTDTTTTTMTTTTATVTTATTITTATTTATITTASGMKEEKKDSAENPISSCIVKQEDSENRKLHSDFAINSATTPATEKSSLVATEEKANLLQSSSSDAVADKGAFTDNANIDRPEIAKSLKTDDTTAGVTANEVIDLQNSANNFEQNKMNCKMPDSTEPNLNIISDQTLKPETVIPTGLMLSENRINNTAAIVEPSDAVFVSSDEKKEKNDLKDGGVTETGEGIEKDNLEKDYKAKEESTSLDDKEASSDEVDHFVDAKSSTQIDGASGDDTVENSEEIKEQTEEIQDEDGYEYDDEEQEAEPDDDEVEGNPAFIPKSGRYYMHDSRNTDEERMPEPSSHSRADGKWKHDRFDERSQGPKTKRELMNRYGYDIRNEGKNSGGGGSMNASAPHSSQTRGTTRGSNSGGNKYGNRGRHSNRALPHHPQHQPDDRRDHRRPVQNSGAGKPANRGGRKGENHHNINYQRDQHGTRVFKNSPMNAQKGPINRTDNHRSYDRNEEYMHDNRQNGGRNRGRGGTGFSSGDASTAHSKGSGAHTGGKRYSTQRLATNYVPNIQQPPPPQPQPPQPPPPPLQSPPTTGPIPIPPPDWRPPAYQAPPPPSTVPPPPPPPIAIPAPVSNFRPSDIVYFDPQPQQLYRNPIPPRTKKRLEIVPPYQAKNSN
uniref:Protein CASC3 n=1 Tax=Loa loa TaxID=7209 RepID=A0A1I7V765_LOALO